MCAVLGALLNIKNNTDVVNANIQLAILLERACERGRDGFGYTAVFKNTQSKTVKKNFCFTVDEVRPSLDLEIIPLGYTGLVSFISNLRAEPTTEFVKEKKESDQQPYSLANWSIVHNGTIANDKDLRLTHYASSGLSQSVPTTIDSAAIVETLESVEVEDYGPQHTFFEAISRLKGSYAVIAQHKDVHNRLYLACNYRPIWAYKDRLGVYFASSEDYFNVDQNGFNRPFLLPAYYNFIVSFHDSEFLIDSYSHQHFKSSELKDKSLVVCSGGLDSVVSATYVKKKLGHEVTLIHFLYGSRAEGPEVEAVKKVAEKLDCPLVLFNLPIYDKTDSPLLQEASDIAEAETGAEYAHEWVPARNLVLLSVATAYAEAKGFNNIVLGNNLEEAGAYPDNEPEFINRLNATLKYAVGDGKSVQIVMPVGNMMKHEIVKLGLELGAPMDVTWSCYHSKELHCGHCGPCFMRKTAFKINKAKEVISYGNEHV